MYLVKEIKDNVNKGYTCDKCDRWIGCNQQGEIKICCSCSDWALCMVEDYFRANILEIAKYTISNCPGCLEG